MYIILLIILVLCIGIVLFMLYKLFKWTLKSKTRILGGLSLMGIVLLIIIINHLFFKNMWFIQSEVYPNLYLVKYPNKNQKVLEQAIVEKIKEHLKTEHKTGKPLAYTNENGIYFYEYGGRTFGFIGEAGTGYFIEHEEDLGGFVTEELGMYTNYRLAEFYFNLCEQDSTLICGEINYFKEGEFFKADSINRLTKVK